MNIILQNFARKYLKENIIKLDEELIVVFKKMYSNGHMDRNIDLVIDKMDSERLDHAMTQVRNSL